jgi:hypothetical protein
MQLHTRTSGPQALYGYANTVVDTCIEACENCHAVCQETLNYCLDKGGELAVPSLLRAILECGDIANVAGRFVERHFDHHEQICRTAAEICKRGAKSFSAFSHLDAKLAECAEACRECAEACNALIHTHAEW